ncbi:MAG: hypothetical protein ACOVLD_04845 [Bacteroidia bacterium]
MAKTIKKAAPKKASAVKKAAPKKATAKRQQQKNLHLKKILKLV